jgi:hypothetical protein
MTPVSPVAGVYTGFKVELLLNKPIPLVVQFTEIEFAALAPLITKGCDWQVELSGPAFAIAV